MNRKLVRFNQILFQQILFQYRTTTSLSSHSHSSLIAPTIQCLIRRNFSDQNNLSEEYLDAYVDSPFSYAFGRSNRNTIYKTIGQMIEERLQNDLGHPVIVSHQENITKTYGQFYREVNQLAKALHDQLGMKPGDVIGIWSCNSYDWILIQYACARLGVVLCTLNPFYQTYELNYALRKSEIKTLFMPGKKSKQEIVNRFSKIMINILEISDESSALDLHLQNIVTMDGDSFDPSDIPREHKVNLHSLDKMKQQTGEFDTSIVECVTPDDPFMIMFTSGTTGRPKGACLSHYSVANNVALTAYKHKVDENTSLCLPLPFFHAFAGVLGTLALLREQLKIVIPFFKYNTKILVEAMNQHKVTHIYATPTLAIDILNYARNNNVSIPSLSALVAGGASVPVEIAHQFIETFPNCKDFRIGYGCTECGPCSTACTPLSTFEEATETVGMPLDLVEVKLINPQTKKVVELGEHGELHTRGHHIMLEYWREPEKTAEVIDKAGWYNTGDLAVMNEKGYVKIIGRTKELIIVGGENVYPREIEELLYTHPSIETVHVIGVPDERKGEEICAWVHLRKDAKITEEELRKFCQEKLTYFKVPKYFLFVDAFPLTPTGKAKKYLMREMTIEKLNLNAGKKQSGTGK